MRTRTSTLPTAAHHSERDAEHDRAADARALRTALRANAAFSVITGITCVVAGGSIADLLGLDLVWLVRSVGAALLGFAGLVLTIAALPSPMVRSLSLPISIADLGWVVGTGVVVLAGLVSTTAAIVLVAVAAVVFELAVTQLVTRR